MVYHVGEHDKPSVAKSNFDPIPDCKNRSTRNFFISMSRRIGVPTNDMNIKIQGTSITYVKV